MKITKEYILKSNKIAIVLAVILFTCFDAPAEERSLASYEHMTDFYHQDVSINNSPFVWRFLVPPNWRNDSENPAAFNSDLFLIDGKGFNMFMSFAVLVSSLGGDIDYQTAINNLQQAFEESGYQKDNFLSSLKSYDNREFLVMTIKEEEYEYRRVEVFLVVKEAPNFLLRMAFQVNNFNELFFKNNLPTLIRVMKSMRIAPKSNDVQTREDYMKDVVSKILKNSL